MVILKKRKQKHRVLEKNWSPKLKDIKVDTEATFKGFNSIIKISGVIS